MKYLPVILGTIIAILAVAGIINGVLGEMSAISVFFGGIAVAIAVARLDRLKRIKIPGVEIELREQIEEAHKALRITFKLLLTQAKNHGGGLDSLSIPKDDRVDFFWELYEHTKEANLVGSLRKEVLDTATVIANGQKSRILCGEMANRDLSLEEMRVWANDEDRIATHVKHERPTPDPREIRKLFNDTVDAYEELHGLIEELQKS